MCFVYDWLQLAADPDQNVRSGSELLDRLLKVYLMISVRCLSFIIIIIKLCCQCGSASTSRWRSLPTRYRRRRRCRIWILCCTDTSAHVPYGRPTSQDSSSREHTLNSLDTLFLFLLHPSRMTSLTTFDSVKLFQHSRNI